MKQKEQNLSMNMLRNAALGAALAGGLGASVAVADNFSADVSDDAFKFAYETTGVESELSWNAAALVHDDSGEIYSVGAQVVGQSLQKSNIQGALGVRFYYVDLESDLDGSALGLGGAMTVALPEVDALSLQFEAYFAPGVLCFGDLERNVDVSIRALYRVLTNGSVYLGYRKASVDFGFGSGDVDDGLHIGMQLNL